MTFDNELELYKVRQFHPSAKMVVRIKVDDSQSTCRFSLKFGADLERVPALLKLAKALGIDVIGVSFHVGSGCNSADQYMGAIGDAKKVFQMGEQLGFNMTLLDLGGGYPGTANAPVSFEETATVINAALARYFPEVDENGVPSQVRIIAEPGRYYVSCLGISIDLSKLTIFLFFHRWPLHSLW